MPEDDPTINGPFATSDELVQGIVKRLSCEEGNGKLCFWTPAYWEYSLKWGND